jgi:hypothetical protein
VRGGRIAGAVMPAVASVSLRDEELIVFRNIGEINFFNNIKHLDITASK